MSKIPEDKVVDLVAPLERDFGGMDLMTPQPDTSDGDMVPYGGRTLMTMNQQVITAQRVAVRRHLPSIIQELNVLCQTFGDRFMYGWDVGKGSNKSRVEGGTIQLANALVQSYGNCSVHVEIDQNDTHWIFKAFFIDYEKGTSVSRLFQQRKKSGMGGNYEADRALDMVFQVGQSKAIRNVVLNALGTLRDYCVEQSRNAIVRKFQDPENRKRAWEFIDQTLAENGIDLRQVEALRGRRAGKFTVPDLARTYSEMVAIRDGMINAEEVYPSKAEADDTEIDGEDAAAPARQANPSGRGTGRGKKKDADDAERKPDGNGDSVASTAAAGKSAGASSAAANPGRGNDRAQHGDSGDAEAGGQGVGDDPAREGSSTRGGSTAPEGDDAAGADDGSADDARDGDDDRDGDDRPAGGGRISTGEDRGEADDDGGIFGE